MSVTIYHNPNCKTSCAVLKMIREKGHDPIVIDYLNDPPAKSDLIELINHMRVNPWDLVRKKEAAEIGLSRKDANLTTLISAIARNPAIMEHPIVVTSTNGKICRPAQLVDELLGSA